MSHFEWCLILTLIDSTCHIGELVNLDGGHVGDSWIDTKGKTGQRRYRLDTLFKGINVQKGRILSYELNPPFAIFCNTGKHSSGSNEVGSSLIRYGSLVAGEEGFEPSFTDPESAVLPLDDSPVRQNYSM